MYRPFTFLLILLISYCVNAQKDCTHDHTGLIPLTDLGPGTYLGATGGLYPGGSNIRPPDYLNKCIEHVQQIQPLNMEGEFDEDGKIVMLGIGASNPGAEFQKFVTLANAFEPLNDHLQIVNGCIPSTGIQEMDYTLADYWLTLNETLLANGISPEQVQIIWIEEENTLAGDTIFPDAALNLVNDYLSLLQTIHILFPNTQICYLTARAYSGYATPFAPGIENGLLYPRDYMNGWAIKWFIENVINNELGYDFEEPGADIPLVTWGTYHWTDGSTPRLDGLYLDCEEDVVDDGLHLSGSGELKMGELMFNYFASDTTAKYWFYDEDYTAIHTIDLAEDLKIYPNPSSDQSIHIHSDLIMQNEIVTVSIYSPDGKLQISRKLNYDNGISLDLENLKQGIYLLTMNSDAGTATRRLIIAD